MNIDKIDSKNNLTLQNTPGQKKTRKQVTEIEIKQEKDEKVLSEEKQKEIKMTRKELEKEIENLNKVSERLNLNRELSFSVHENTGRIVVRIINSENNELIRQIPEQKFLDVISKFREILGLVVDDEI